MASTWYCCSKLSAKVDNTAIQDGFQLYLHNFIVSDEGEWAVVQQGMSPHSSTARRYHWHSPTLTSFVNEPHITSICGENQGMILNMVAHDAQPARSALMDMAQESPDRMIERYASLPCPPTTTCAWKT